MNRKRVLWPLLLAAAFSLGVLVAQVQAANIFLPLVAKASTGQETPTPSGTVRVVNLHHYVRGATHHFLGEVVNETGYTVGIGDVKIDLFDADGVLVGTVRVACLAGVIPPGQRVPFETYESSLWPFVLLTSTVPWWEVDYLTIEQKALTKGDDRWVVTALVRNQLPYRVDWVVFGAVLYGSSGEVIGYDQPRQEHVDLGPGEMMQTTHSFWDWDWDTSVEPVGCAAFAVPCGRSGLAVMEQGQQQEAEER